MTGSGSRSAPVVDPRDRDEIADAMRRRVPGYTPGFMPRQGGPGAAVLDVLAGHLAVLADGLDQVPDRSRLAFLDMLGIGLLPATSARAPLVFQLQPDAPVDVDLPKHTRVAAPAAPVPASPLNDEQGTTDAEDAVFATTSALTITRASLAAVYSIDPASDTYAEHTGDLTSGFSLFGGLGAVEHALYIAHDQHLNMAGEVTILLSLQLSPYPPGTVRPGLEIAWSYLSADGWIPLEIEDDQTDELTHSGVLRLVCHCGPDSGKSEIDGHESYWIRGVLQTPLPPDGLADGGRLPAIDVVQLSVEFSKHGLAPDGAFHDGFTLDLSNRFHPFGPRPELYGTFYLACEEAFSRADASVTVHLHLAKTIEDHSPTIGWQYFNGKDWKDLDDHDLDDGTEGLTRKKDTDTGKRGAVSFTAPEDWAPTKVNGTEGYWLRARIDEGDYGEPMRLELDDAAVPTSVTLQEATYDPPIVEKVSVSYTYQTAYAYPDHCLTYNEFTYSDHSEDARWPRRPFEPLVPLSDSAPAVVLAFDRELPVGLLSLYVHVPDDEVTEHVDEEVSSFVWEYLGSKGWLELGVYDETAGFQRSGMIQLVGPRDAVATDGLGGMCYRLRARRGRGAAVEEIPLQGLWLNAVWATHRERVDDEILGISNGNPSQSFELQRAVGSVLEGEVLEVREWVGKGDGWAMVAQEVEEDQRRLELDQSTGAVSAVWVRWQGVAHLLAAGPDDRCYTIERAEGRVRFGDGERGMIPPATSRISIAYDSGGGLIGNVGADQITQLRTSLPYAQSVTNPIAASGGAQSESSSRVAKRGAHQLRHRQRAITPSDYEWLAREASPAVHHARCQPLMGPAGFAQRGFVTVVICPDGPEAQPQPSSELRRQVHEHLVARCPAAIASGIRVKGPRYSTVDVVVELVPEDASEAAAVEARVRDNLDAFLHPITGGPQREGWAFGQSVYLSQVASIVVRTSGVAIVLDLRLRVEDAMVGEVAEIDDDALVAAGAHEITITLEAS